MGMLEDDLDAMLSDPLFRVQVVCGGVETWGHEDDAEGATLDPDTGQAVLGRTHTVRIRTGTLPDLALEGSVIVDGRTYRVRDIRKEADRRETLIFLGKRVA